MSDNYWVLRCGNGHRHFWPTSLTRFLVDDKTEKLMAYDDASEDTGSIWVKEIIGITDLFSLRDFLNKELNKDSPGARGGREPRSER